MCVLGLMYPEALTPSIQSLIPDLMSIKMHAYNVTELLSMYTHSLVLFCYGIHCCFSEYFHPLHLLEVAYQGVS